MAEQILKVRLQAEAIEAESIFNLFEKKIEKTGVTASKVMKSLDLETGKVIRTIDLTADSVDKLSGTYDKLRNVFNRTLDDGTEIKNLISKPLEETRNDLAETAKILKNRQVAFEEDLKKRTTRLKESLTKELALIREGDNSITAIKAEAASKQRRLEEQLQQDIAAIKEKYVNQEIQLATKNKYINTAVAEYKEATIQLNIATDERIAKLKEQEAAEKELTSRALTLQEAETRAFLRRRAQAQKEAAEELAAKEKEQADLVKFHLEANYNSRKVMYADLMREMDEADAARVAKEKARAPQAGRDDRGYTPFAMGTVGANRATAEAPKLDRQQSLQEAETRAFLNRRARAEQEWANSFNAVVTPAVEKNTEALGKNKEAAEQVGKSHKSLLGHITEVYGAYQLVNTAVGTFKQFLMDIPKAGIQQEQTQASLFAIFGSKEGYKNIEFLKELGKSAGQYIGDLQEAYTRFAPSAMLAGATQADVNKVFKDFTETSTVLHLGTDQVKSLYLALEQMYAKTTVQSEEIKKQLGNVLPGAVEIGAKAWENYINRGKEGADRTKLSVAEFMDAMSKNLVIAKQFIPEFSAAFKKAFGGPDDSVFLDTRTKLLSNLQRLRSDYFDLSGEIYKRTAGTLNDIVKLGSGALEEIQKNAAGILQAIEVLSIAVAARLSASLVVNLAANLSKVTVLLTGMSAGVLGVATAAVTAAASIANLNVKYEEARGILLAYNNETATITSTLKVVLSDAKDLLTRYLAEYKGFGSEFLKAILPNPVKAVTDFFKQYIPLTLGYLKAARQAFTEEGLTSNLGITAQQFAKDYSAQFDAYGADVITRAVIKDIDNLKEYVKGKPTYEVGKEISTQLAAGLKLSPKDITSMFESSLEIGASDQGSSGEVIKKKNPAEQRKGLNEAYKTALEEAKNASKQIQSDITEALGNIDVIYQQNGLTIENYFSQKMQLQETDLAVQKEMLNQELQLAYAQKDKVKIAKLNGEIIKAETDANKLATKTIKEKAAAERAYQDQVENLHADYMALYGKGGESAGAKFDIGNRELVAKLTAQNDVTSLKEISNLRANAVLKGKLADLDEKRNLLNDEYSNSLDTVNILYNTGAISQLDSLRQISALNEDRIKQMEDMIDLQQKAVDQVAASGQTPSIYEVDKLKKMRAELEKFKLTSDVVALHFEKVFSDSFTNAFTGFANGTMTAKQAFASLVTSMIGEIQKLIAQEMASAALRSIIRPLTTWAMSGIGGMFGGATSVAAGNSAGFTSAMEGSNWMTAKLANGGVFSGAGISAYSGSVVSQPTIFPFAKGTGLMGEAGPEAILPLKRNSQGKLGVSLDNAGQSNSNVYNIAVTVQSSKDEKPADTGQKVAEAIMRSIAKQEIASAARPGNSLNRTTKFG